MKTTTTIVNIFHKKPYDIYIGRSRKGEPKNKFANPYPINEAIGQTREVVIERFRIYLWKQIKEGKITLEELVEMDGKVLGCFCSPKPCHGEIIIKAIEYAKTILNKGE